MIRCELKTEKIEENNFRITFSSALECLKALQSSKRILLPKGFKNRHNFKENTFPNHLLNDLALSEHLLLAAISIYKAHKLVL